VHYHSAREKRRNNSKIIEAILLAGDRKLKSVAQGGNIEVRVIFCMFDEMLNQKVIGKSEFKTKLAKLKSINRRLPEDEFKKRI